jgi:NAD(P)-dependent dehydrogenase (short-subunit alcohol dehydrogenase family)
VTAGGDGPRVWFVTGASRGLGRAVVEAAAAVGDHVVAMVRDADTAAARTAGRVTGVVGDVRDPASVAAAVEVARASHGRIDVLVNAAGYTLLASVEEASEAQIRDQLDTNLLGVVHVCRAALPLVRASARGFVVVVSSVAAATSSAGFAYYSASKHGVEGFAAALAAEVAPMGIRLTIVEPGLFRTDALGASMVAVDAGSAYASTVGAFRAAVDSLSGNQPGSPQRFAAQLLRLVDEPEPPLRLPVDPGATGPIRGRLEQQLAELETWAPRFTTAEEAHA